MHVPPLIIIGFIVGAVGEFALHNHWIAGAGGIIVFIGLFKGED